MSGNAAAQERLKVVSAAETLNQTAFQGTLELDLGNLSAFDPSPADGDAFRKDPDAACLEIGRAITQSLIGEIFNLPTDDTDIGPVAKLPAPTTTLPREKPLPKAKPMTRWQKFAKEKGIMKKKKSKLVFDESSGEWKRRYGYGSIKDEKQVAIMESKGVKAGDDPFSKAKREKQERTAKNKKQQMNNIKAANGEKPSAPTLTVSSSLNFEGSRHGQQGKSVPMKQKGAIKEVLGVAQSSTASVGKFDKKLEGENKKVPGKRQQFLPTVGGEKEKDLVNKTMTKLFKKEDKNILNMEKAVRNFITEGHDANRDAKNDGERNELGMKKRGAGGSGRRSAGGKRPKK